MRLGRGRRLRLRRLRRTRGRLLPRLLERGGGLCLAAALLVQLGLPLLLLLLVDHRRDEVDLWRRGQGCV